MIKASLKFISLFFLIFLLKVNTLWAIDTVRITNALSSMDKRLEYKSDVIKQALELTVPEFGAYEYKIINIRMNRHRALTTIIRGLPSNIYISPANEEWNKKTIPIKIPIRRGLLNYRLLLINKVDLPKFSAVNTRDDLKVLTAGVQSGWVTTEVLRAAQMDYVETQSFDGLFTLLDNQHFNYIPRAIYEIFDELKVRQDLLENVIIEPTLAIHLPMPTYIYVSPTEPRVAKRLEAGLRIMLENGDLDRTLQKFYADDIKRANLKNRKIIKIDNPYYKDNDLLDDKSLWYQL